MTSAAPRSFRQNRPPARTLSYTKCMWRQGAWRLSARLSSRVEWLMNDDGEVEALRSLVRLPWITQQHFVGMLQARRIDQVDVYFLFEWLPLRTAWIADILSQASLRDVERRRCWKRGSGDFGTTLRHARLSDLQFKAVDRRGSTLTWTVCKAIGGSR